jgi:rare lipoprotein A
MRKFFLLVSFFTCVSVFSQTIDKPKGKASFYSDKLHGRNTASGEKYDKTLLTGAHRTLPFGTMVKVKNLKNNKSVIIKINDRGPHHESRIIDVSKKAAEELDMVKDGQVEVELELAKETKEEPKKSKTVVPKVEDDFTFDESFDESFDEFQEDDLKFDDESITPPKKEAEKKPVVVEEEKKVLSNETSGDTLKVEETKKTVQPAVVSDDKSLYAVQVSAYRKMDKAEIFAEKLRRKGYSIVYIQKIMYKNRDMFRVLILFYNAKSSAEETTKKLEGDGLHPILKTYQFTCK